MKYLVFALLLVAKISVAQQEEIQINPDLERALDGRSKVDKLTNEQIKAIAVQNFIEKELGITPEMLKQFKELRKSEQDALFENKPAKMLKEIITVSTDPSSVTPIIYTTPGHDTLVNVIDETGQPWPIVLASSGNNLLFKTEAIKEHSFHNIFRLSSLQRVGSSNVTLLLAGKSLSLTVRVENSKEKFHPQPILQVTERGPNATKDLLSQITASNANLRNDMVMKNLMFGIAPDSFKVIRSSSSKVEIWKDGGGSIFVKTKLHPINPSAISVYSGPSGYSAYELESWPVLIMADDNGVEHQIDVLED